MFRWLEVSLFLVCLVAVAGVIYSYVRSARQARQRRVQRSLDGEVTAYLKRERKE